MFTHSKIKFSKILFLLLIIGSCISNLILAQTPTVQDCLGAIPICMTQYSTQSSYSGTGNYTNEINSSISCLNSGEKNDVWYTFTVQQSGNLSFLITPKNSSDDYDWAVYNLTNATCSNIYSNAALEVSCNYSATTGTTGPNGGSTSNSQTSQGTPYNAVIPVQAGQTYVINVSNYSSSQSGYTIDFSASTAVIYDNVPPRMSSMNTNVVCGASTLNVSFSENVMCYSVQAADFLVTGPGGPYTISQVSGSTCQAGGTRERNFTLTLATPLTTPGDYKLHLLTSSGSVEDLCQNLAPADSLPFTIIPVTANISTMSHEYCNLGNGSATVVAGGTGPFTYNWNSTPPQTTETLNYVSQGTYTVTVTANGCSATASVQIQNIQLPITPSINSVKDGTCGQNNGEITVSAIGGYGDYTYSWSSNPSHNSPTISNLGAGAYTVTISTGSCSSTISANIIVNPNVTAQMVILSQDSCGNNVGEAMVIASSGSPPYSYSWSNGQTNNIVSNLTEGNYVVTVSDSYNCTTTGSVNIQSIGKISVRVYYSNEFCGMSNGYIAAEAIGGLYNLSYTWSTNPPQTNDTATNLSAGIYTVTVTDGFCSATTSASLQNITSTYADFIIIPGRLNIFDATARFVDLSNNSVKWNWDFGDGTQSNAKQPLHTYDSIGTFTVKLEVEDANGCKSSVTKTLIVDDVTTVYIPNAFTPNDDGINDVFLPKTDNIQVGSYELLIFDRWGSVVFSSKDPQEAWNGSINGNKSKIRSDVFTYKLTIYDYKNDRKIFIGTVSVIP